MTWLIIKDRCKSLVSNVTSWRAGRSRELLILALADGMSYREIERKLGACAPTVSK